MGFELDSMALIIRLLEEKLTELRQLIQTWVGRKSCSRKELESLVGKLGHAARVMTPGRTFMRCMFELLASVRQAHHHVRLNTAFCSDLLWWVTFLDTWNGVTMMWTLTPGQPIHGCVWSLQMRGSVPSRAIMAATAVAALSPTESDTILGGEYPPSGTPTHILACALWGLFGGYTCNNMGAVLY